MKAYDTTNKKNADAVSYWCSDFLDMMRETYVDLWGADWNAAMARQLEREILTHWSDYAWRKAYNLNEAPAHVPRHQHHDFFMHLLRSILQSLEDSKRAN